LSRATARNSKSAAGKLSLGGKISERSKATTSLCREAHTRARTRRVYRGDGGVARVGVTNS
jgi:hypothetical protein